MNTKINKDHINALLITIVGARELVVGLALIAKDWIIVQIMPQRIYDNQ